MASAFEQRCQAALANADRCRLEEIVADGDRRYLLHNFRRQSTGAPGKLLL